MLVTQPIGSTTQVLQSLPGCSSHPDHIMVSPLNVNIISVLYQILHDNVGTGTPVKDITDYMKSGDRQFLYHIGHGHDEVTGPANADDGVKNLIIILFLLNYPVVLTEQFLQNIGKILWEGRPQSGSGILG